MYQIKQVSDKTDIIQFLASDKDVNKFLKSLAGKKTDYFLLKSSYLKVNKKLRFTFEQYFVFYQDLEIDEFYQVAELFIERFFLHFWFFQKPFSFFSSIEKKNYIPKKIISDELHANVTLVENKIVTANLIYLLEHPKRNDLFEHKHHNLIPLEKDLDTLQNQAICSLEGIVKVLAPAGSGKTKTLVNRIINLINSGAKQDRILAVSFNKKAMLEMKHRLTNFGIKNVEVRTLHSLGYDIIRKKIDWRYSEKNNLKTQKQILNLVLKKLHKDDLFLTGDKIIETLSKISSIKLEISNFKNQKFKFDEFEVSSEILFKEFLAQQKKLKFITFDDMIYFALCFLVNDIELCNLYRKKFDFILVDEFQDLNLAQLMIVKIISHYCRNIFVVGDDDQLIYNWCGAKPEYILNFGNLNTFKKEIILSFNYRSKNNIVVHSKNLIENNQVRVMKEIKSRQPDSTGLFDVILKDSLNGQVKAAIEWIKIIKEKEKGKGTKENSDWSEFCFLYRYNVLEVLIAIELDKYKIPHTPINFSRLFKNSVGYLIFSYFKLILFPESVTRMDLDFVLRKPSKYLSRKIIKSIHCWEDLEDLVHSADLKYYELKSIEKFYNNVCEIMSLVKKKKISAKKLMEYLNSSFGLDEYYGDKKSSFADFASDNLIYQVIQAVSINYPSVNEFYDIIEKSLSEENEEMRSGLTSSNDEITLTSIHRTKGNEYNNIIFFNFSNEEYELEEIESERRVAYVGITRAKNNILLTAASDNPSIFLLESVLNPKFTDHTDEEIFNLINKSEKQIGKNIKKSKSLKREGLPEITSELNELKEELKYRSLLKGNYKKQNDISF